MLQVMMMPDRFGMHDPDVMDPPDRPFSYFANPNDIIGTFGAPVSSEVTPEGYVFTGFGELMFFTGNPPLPTWQRIRTLHRGYLPAVEYDLARDGVRYDFRLFAADLGAGLRGIPVNFVRVTVTNTTAEPRAAFVSTGWRFRGPVNTAYTQWADYRFQQRYDNLPPHLVEGQTTFDPRWKYRFAHDALLRDGRLVYTYPAEPRPLCESLAMNDSGLRMQRYFSGEIEGDPDPALDCDPHTPLGIVTYCLQLQPGESRELTYKLPLVPLPDASPEAQQVREADHDEAFAQAMAFWEGLIASHPPLRFPETKVQEYLVGNTIANLLAIDQVGEDTIVNVNKFQYHGWYGGGNPNNMMRAMEYMGLLDIARRGLLFLRSRQCADGSFRVQHQEQTLYWEMWGYNLWGWARHFQLTRDREFLETVYPGVRAAMAWQERIVGEDPLGLWPPATIADDAFLKNCRQTGQHLWGLIGLRSAGYLAMEMGREDDRARFEEQQRRFREAFDRLLKAQTDRTGGYIPPALERTTGGNDWDNLLTLYPELLFDPRDPRVEATLREVRSRYEEGILSYTWPSAVARDGDAFIFNEQPGLHYWQTPNNAHVSLVRGTAWDQEWAVKELYALLVHTTSTHLPAEFGTIPWSTREPSHCFNILPQGATSAKTIELLRNMLVREQGEDLFLLSAVSPEWVLPARAIEVVEEPTAFGPINMRVAAGEDRLTINLPSEFRNTPQRLWLRVPWFFDVQRAAVDGEPLAAEERHFLLPPGSRELVVWGCIRRETPALSYAQAVADYRAEYRCRHEHFLRTGSRALPHE